MWGNLESGVVVPFWVLIALGILSALALLDRLLLPSIRWAARRHANKAIEKLNTRLKLHIQPFKLTRRRLLIDRLLFDPEVLAAVETQARETGSPREVCMHQAAAYAREIVPSFSAYAYFKIGTRLARKISSSLYRVRLGAINEAALSAVPPDASVVFVINHRSNMDYVLVTYIASSASALSYAVGEWAQVWGLRELLKSMGAYFIRRNSRNPLYRRVLARYVDMATKAGVVQAVFPEGGLSRTGLLQPTKLGLLSYMVSGFDPQGAKDIVFIPVGVNYDRVLEDRVLTAAAHTPPGQQPKFRFNAAILMGYTVKNIGLLLRGAWHRHGYACVCFGAPVSLKKVLEPRGLDYRTMPPDERHAEIEVLGQRLISEIGKVVPVVPVSLVATAILGANPQSLTLFEIKGRVFDLIGLLEQAGAYVHIPRRDRDYAIDVGLRMLEKRRPITRSDAGFAANGQEIELLQYYANSIAHLLPQSTRAAVAAE
jgi:glycerol-3-phosphate O-acyltransferase